MNSIGAHEFEQLSSQEQDRLDRACDQFESQLRAGEDVAIEQFLSLFSGDLSQRTALYQLVGLDMYYRPARSAEACLQHYSSRFPGFEDVVKAAVAENIGLFAPGTQIGPYRIERQLGAGGMGVVYIALDERLGRDVAVKVLPATVDGTEQSVRWLQKEAKMLAALSHPHIATLYGFESFDGVYLCVLEYVPGRTLSEVIRDVGRMPTNDVQHVFFQVSAALEHAHSRGVVHRDLKPANIVIQPNDDVKLLDFGLAMQSAAVLDRTSAQERLTDVETLKMAGTVPYMSPEQVRGKPVDKRADIWAFGCCLYEALTGQRIFRGDSLADVVSAILNNEPDWDALPGDTPPALRFVLRRSLEKEPSRRLRDIGDAWLPDDILESLRDSRSRLPSPTEFSEQVKSRQDSPSSQPRRRTTVAWIPWALFAAAAIGLLFAWFGPTNSTEPVAATYEDDILLPTGQHLALDYYGPLGEPRRSIAVSPDGQLLAYVAVDSHAENRSPHIFVKTLGSFDAPLRLDGTDGAYHVFFSPNGQTIGFFARGWLKRIPTHGGTPTDLCEVCFPVGGTWSDDGKIYVGDYFGDRLVTIDEYGRQTSTVQGGWRDKDYQWIEALPNGQGLLSSRRSSGLTHIDTRTGQQHCLLPLGTAVHPFYAAGQMFHAVDGKLMACAFDESKLEITSEPTIVLQELRTGQWGVGQFAISPAGTLAYIPGISGRRTKLARVTAEQIAASDGGEIVAEPLSFLDDNFGMFSISPDSQSLAIEIHKETTNIWRYDLLTTNRRQLTFQGNNRNPIWSPDGKYIVFTSDREGEMNLFLKSSQNESASVERLTPKSESIEYPYSWVKDNEVGYRHMSEDGHTLKVLDFSEIQAVNIRPMKNTSYMSQPNISPNGKWVIYTDWQPGDRATVQLQRFPSSGDNWPVSGAKGGEEAVWSESGDKIIYRIGMSWMSVDFEPPLVDGGAPKLSLPKLLFSGNFINVSGISYGITSRGDFLLLQSLQDAKPNQINTVQNWLQTLPHTYRGPRIDTGQ